MLRNRCGYALDAETAGDFETDVTTDVRQSYARTDPSDGDTQGEIDALDALFDDPDVKTALLDRRGVKATR